VEPQNIQSATNLSIAIIMDLNVFVIPNKILKCFGLWQNKNASRFYAAYGIFMHLIFIGLNTLFQFLHVIDIESTDELLDFLIFCPCFVSIFIKSLVFVAKAGEIECLLATMKDLITKVNFTKQYEHETRFIGRFFKISLALCFISNIIATCSSFALQILPFKMWLPFEVHENSLTFFLVATFSNVSTFGFGAVGVCLNVFADFFMNYAVILLEDFNENFESQQVYDKKKNPKVENRKRFLQLIDEHRKIKELIQEMTNIFNPFWLVEGLTCSIILCAASYSLTTVSDANLEFIDSQFVCFSHHTTLRFL